MEKGKVLEVVRLHKAAKRMEEQLKVFSRLSTLSDDMDMYVGKELLEFSSEERRQLIELVFDWVRGKHIQYQSELDAL